MCNTVFCSPQFIVVSPSGINSHHETAAIQPSLCFRVPETG